MRRWISNVRVYLRANRKARHARHELELAPMTDPAGPAAAPTIPYAEVDGQPPWKIDTSGNPHLSAGSDQPDVFLGRSGAPLDGTRPAWLLPQPGGWVSGGGWPDEEDSGVWRRRMADELAPEVLNEQPAPPGQAFAGLGPNAARVLANYRQRFAERWAYTSPPGFDVWALA